MNRPYQICTHCIMDTTDPKIVFDEQGVCDHCCNFKNNIAPNWHTDERGAQYMEKVIAKIKKDGQGKAHDCLIGISGGTDSSYLTYLAKEKFGLRPLIFHVDAGWNSQQAVHNIEKLVDALKLDLHTEVIDWREMRDLQLAFFKAQVQHIDTPQDLAYFASLYSFAKKNKFKYILTGANFSTECIRNPLEWSYFATDLKHVKDIHKKFGTIPLKKFPMVDIFKYKILYRFLYGIKVIQPLNKVPYIKDEAMQLLMDKFGWQKHAHKHYESRFTRFYEGYWQPKKFGIDKRIRDFSSLILTGQMTREEALKRMEQPAYDEATIMNDFEYVATKLGISTEELQTIMNGPNKTYRDYKTNLKLINLGAKVLRALGIERRILR